MNIGINLLAVVPNISGGIESYIHNLLSSLCKIDRKNEYYLFTNIDNSRVFDFQQDNFHQVSLHVRARPQLRRIMWEQAYLPIAAKKLRLHVLHSPSYTWPIFSSAPGVVTICDMLYRVLPECLDKRKLTFWRLLIPWSARRCAKVLTISEYSKYDIVKYLRLPSEKVIVTPLALDMRLSESCGSSTEQRIEEVCAKYQIRRPYILSIGSIGTHKNPVTLVKGLKVLHKRLPTRALSLVLAGNDNGAKAEIELAVKSLGVAEFVRLTGYVLREDLPALYAGAVAYTSLSYFEGFGLTLLEAMACHTPVVVSNCTSLPEVAGNAALIVDPDNIEQLADAIYHLASYSQYRTKMIEEGALRVKEFSWERAANLTLQVYNEVAADSAPAS